MSKLFNSTRIFKLLTILLIINYSFSNVIDYINQSNWDGYCKDQSNGSPINLVLSTDVKSQDDVDVSIELLTYPSHLINIKKDIFHEKSFNYSSEKVTNNFVYFRIEKHYFKYYLVSAHFHCPTEHHLNGTEYDCELHLVHQRSVIEEDIDQNNYLVIGILFQAKENANTNLIADEKASIDLNEFLSQSRQYFYYKGSLTTPPCSPSVNWLVLSQVIDASPSQIQSLKTWINSVYNYNIGNDRDVQKVNSRTVALLSYSKKDSEAKYFSSSEKLSFKCVFIVVLTIISLFML